MKLYINGLFVGCAKTVSGPIEFPSEGAPQGSVDVVMGGLVGGVTDEVTGGVSEASFMIGNIDEVRIWSVARAQEDIFAFMHRTVRDEFLGPLPEGLELYWRFDFDVIACDPQYDWLPCHYTCDEVRQFKAHMMTHDAKNKGVEIMPSDVPLETLTLARGCQQCPPYPDVEYGTWTPAGGVGAGDHIEITCDDGFRSKPLGENGEGTVSPECQFDMTFTPGVQCVAVCAPLDAPPHGSVSPTGDIEMFDWVTLNCDEGYLAVGNRYVMCKPDHEYLFDHGTCVATCSAYPTVTNGNVVRTSDSSTDDLLAGESVRITCDEGYVLAFDSSQVATCGDGGEYDFPSATCLPVCTAHPDVANGQVSVTGPTILGDEVQITCNENYELAFPEMASVVCTASHEYTKPWQIKANANGKQYAFSHCVAICPPYPYVDGSTITVDGRWETAGDPVREGSHIVVTCDEGFDPGPYNGGGRITATCIDDGKGGGGVYDPPQCGPLGSLDPKPHFGYDACTPARCIEPEPPVLPPPPPPKVLEAPMHQGDPAGGWGLNIRCADFRDKAVTFAEKKQIEYLTGCMEQDCVQSLEGGNANRADEVGCRYTDANGFCYHSGSTQMWCKDNSDDARCIDGGTLWAIPELGSAPGTPSAWMPVANYPLRGAAKALGLVVSCSCMKNCGCSHSSKESKCFCTHADQLKSGVGPWGPDRIIRSGKDGECACVCVAGEPVSAEPVVMQPPDNLITLPPPPPPEVEGPSDPVGGWGLNIRCADFRDKAATFAEQKQNDYITKCMEQDCVQSLEGGNSNRADEVGCRYTDANGFCYHSGSTQMWCKDNSDDARCIDGGTLWAIPELGSAPGAPSAWTPVANFPLRGAANAVVVSCSCMKNCGCSHSSKESKCFCSDADQQPSGLGPWVPDRIIRSGKDGECACVCVAGEVMDITVVSGGEESTESEGMEKITIGESESGGMEVQKAPEPMIMAPPVITLPPPPPMDIDGNVCRK